MKGAKWEKLVLRHCFSARQKVRISDLKVHLVYRVLHVNFFIENKSSCDEVKSPF